MVAVKQFDTEHMDFPIPALPNKFVNYPANTQFASQMLPYLVSVDILFGDKNNC